MNAARSRASMSWSGRAAGNRDDRVGRAVAEQTRMDEARDPVAEAVGRIVRPDDEARPHVERALRRTPRSPRARTRP